MKCHNLAGASRQCTGEGVILVEDRLLCRAHAERALAMLGVQLSDDIPQKMKAAPRSPYSRYIPPHDAALSLDENNALDLLVKRITDLRLHNAALDKRCRELEDDNEKLREQNKLLEQELFQKRGKP